MKAIKRLLSGWLPGGDFKCPMCGCQIRCFMPYRKGVRVPLMHVLDMVGSDIENFACPRCGAHDRERHLLLYMQATGLLAEMHGKDILHFAPEKHFSKRIVDAGPSRYVRCDLFPTSPDILRIDLTHMDIPSHEFHVLIANHVLEHVSDHRRALSEIVRVLKPGGWAILQTPFSRKLLRTWEDDGIADEAARLQAYGQEDHVRLYGRDIFGIIASCGLIQDVRTHEECLPDIDARIVGVNPNEPLFLFRKAT